MRVRGGERWISTGSMACGSGSEPASASPATSPKASSSNASPSLVDGTVPITLHLLAPNRRAVQVTTDLESFWRTHYPGLRKQLSRRYPKHDWPEEPSTAKPPPPRGRRRKRG